MAGVFVLLAFVALAEPVSALPWVLDRLREVHREHEDVQYQFGGCNDLRMDCSCFVQTAFREAFGRKLPRTTLSQTRYFQGSLLSLQNDIRRLGPTTLCPGDLIYTYRGSKWQTASRHVAIYFDRGRILHSASGAGVTIQPLGMIGHHRLHGVVRLFECRGQRRSDPGPSAPRWPSRPEAPQQDDARTAALKENLRDRVHRFFVAWQEQDRPAFASFWGEGSVQWRKGAGGSSSEFSNWNRTFRELGGRQWIYSVRALQAREPMAFVEVETEQVCPSTRRRDCGKTTQTFVWQLGSDGQWRIVQHEIGAAD